MIARRLGRSAVIAVLTVAGAAAAGAASASAASASAQAAGPTQATLTYDATYDDANASLANVACSDGDNGLMTKGYTTLSSLPSFPNVAGVPAVTGWNSPSCGTAWQITDPATGNSIDVVAVDSSASDFTVSQAAMNALTNGQGAANDTLNVTVQQVDPSTVGL